jgi:hypothetical protein
VYFRTSLPYQDAEIKGSIFAVAYPLLRVEKKKAEELPRDRVVDSDHIYNKEQSAR